MSTKGEIRVLPPVAWVRLGCGHVVLFAAPYPQANDELTCGVCGMATEVTP